MATNFPTSLDALTNPTSGSALNSPSHADQHADANDAIEALQAKVGVNGSAVTTSLDYKVENGVLPKLNVDSGVLVVDATNNRVGVNVSSPAHALDVVGRVEARAAATQDGVAIVGRAGGTSSFDVALTPTTLTADRTLTLPDVSGTAITTGNLSSITSTGTLSSLTVTGDVTVDTNTLKVDSANNRVGVVNASPAYALDVTGDINASSALRIGGNTVGTSETFTPTIVGSTSGSVTIGNGSLLGYYYRVNKMVVVNYTLTWGSTTTTNCVGLWLFSVPLGNALRGNGFGRILDAGNTYYRVTGIAGSNKAVFQGTDTGSEVQNTVPMTWANGDVLNATFVYETSA